MTFQLMKLLLVLCVVVLSSSLTQTPEVLGSGAVSVDGTKSLTEINGGTVAASLASATAGIGFRKTIVKTAAGICTLTIDGTRASGLSSSQTINAGEGLEFVWTTNGWAKMV